LKSVSRTAVSSVCSCSLDIKVDTFACHELTNWSTTTGHSFSGSSTKKNTLLLNMNKYTHYAPDGITDCDEALIGTTVADDLSNQACVLALARNKSSLIRVGGGENFGKILL
jgi:hypothetical protein